MDFKICIIGAGVVGLAIARELSKKHKGIVVIEKNLRFGEETSSRNSEVIHSGIYYPAGSLKAGMCKNGNRMLYEYCEQNHIPHNKCGKLIVTTHSDQLPQLNKLLAQGMANGVENIQLLTKEEINESEPDIYAENALFIPSTGIIDSHRLMKQLYSDSLTNGVDFVFQSRISGIRKMDKGYILNVEDGTGSGDQFTSARVINCAGLDSEKIARMTGIEDEANKLHFCKGEYFKLAGSGIKRLRHLVYPVPDPKLAGLGIHTTLSLDGSMKLGPNVIYLEENMYDYSVDPSHKKTFFEAASKYLPFLEEHQLEPEMAGIRPKLQAEGEDFRDFVIQDETSRGFPGWINLTGIESPGLTSCLSIGKYVGDMFQESKDIE
ncbi:MAG TPA: NAD(P)/FAD-dependent oxidoreductase [Saprospirales bacterium]|nr:NAD(P)/FAD-dependent oxidoreductase [Saprospirales bacterium]HAY71324.1 NAD(P)/FAD-dependent oxidoreductase [Saprospirales bacterium]HRQ29666.1 NAD(P)/FAD-dependent oxidoreductase [Saprospiraceae bacterium]